MLSDLYHFIFYLSEDEKTNDEIVEESISFSTNYRHPSLQRSNKPYRNWWIFYTHKEWTAYFSSAVILAKFSRSAAVLQWPFQAAVGHLACYTHPFAEWTRYWQMTTKGFMGTYKWRYYQTARKYLVVNCSALASRVLVSEDYLNYDQLSPWVIWFMGEFDGSKRGLELNRSNVWLLCFDWWCVSIMCISNVYIYRFYRRCINAVIKFVRKYRINI